jgi:hypothetical protein
VRDFLAFLQIKRKAAIQSARQFKIFADVKLLDLNFVGRHKDFHGFEPVSTATDTAAASSQKLVATKLEMVRAHRVPDPDRRGSALRGLHHVSRI